MSRILPFSIPQHEKYVKALITVTFYQTKKTKIKQFLLIRLKFKHFIDINHSNQLIELHYKEKPARMRVFLFS